MSEPQPGLIAPSKARSRAGHAIAHLSFDFLLALSCTLLCRAMTGATLGFLFAPVFLATIFTPPLVLAIRKIELRIAAWLAISLGVSVGWLVFDGLRPEETFRCIFVLAAYLLALAGQKDTPVTGRLTATAQISGTVGEEVAVAAMRDSAAQQPVRRRPGRRTRCRRVRPPMRRAGQ